MQRSSTRFNSRLAGLLLGLSVFATSAIDAHAEDVAVPVRLEAELLAKTAPYDRNFAARVGDTVRVLIVVAAGNPESAYVASQMDHALGGDMTIGGFPVEKSTVDFPGASALADTVRAKQIAIVYFTPGLSNDIPATAQAFEGSDVLSVAAVPAYVRKRAVLGFDVVAGKPKLLVNLAQARKQGVLFDARLLRLAEVVE